MTFEQRIEEMKLTPADMNDADKLGTILVLALMELNKTQQKLIDLQAKYGEYEGEN